jgi:hypothetical protein
MRQEPEIYGFLISKEGYILLMDKDEFVTYTEAITGPESETWLEAFKSEMDSMYTNQVWNLVEAPEGINLIGCKWVFKKKTDMDGKVNTYNSQLVSKAFKQIHGVDYDENFSLVIIVRRCRFRIHALLLYVNAIPSHSITHLQSTAIFI